jgi:hypothetical protein
MKFLAIAVTATLLPLAAHAGSAIDPVTRIMKVAEARWATTEGGTADYFDNLDRDFSKDFAAVYREASKYPAYDGGDSPFDYDVITSSQDGCPLKDMKISPEGEKGGISIIAASFRLMACAPDAESQAVISELKFDVVTEDGKPVIADVHRFSEGKWNTLLGEMKEGIEYAKKNQP